MRLTRQILLADDDTANRADIRAMFANSAAVELTVVSDGRAAVEVAMTQKFDLLIVGQNIPQISGDRVVRHLRASNSPNACTPVIRFSGDTPPFSRADGEKTVVMPKSRSRENLISVVAELLAAV